MWKWKCERVKGYSRKPALGLANRWKYEYESVKWKCEPESVKVKVWKCESERVKVWKWKCEKKWKCKGHGRGAALALANRWKYRIIWLRNGYDQRYLNICLDNSVNVKGDRCFLIQIMLIIFRSLCLLKLGDGEAALQDVQMAISAGYPEENRFALM